MNIFRLSEFETKNFEREEKLTKFEGVLKNLENKVPSKESINAIKEKAMKVSQAYFLITHLIYYFFCKYYLFQNILL